MYGRYLIITGMILHTFYTHATFSNNLLCKITCRNTLILILGGDLNCVTDPSLDHSSPSMMSHSNMAKSFSDFSDFLTVSEWLCWSLEVSPSSLHKHSSFHMYTILFLSLQISSLTIHCCLWLPPLRIYQLYLCSRTHNSRYNPDYTTLYTSTLEI